MTEEPPADIESYVRANRSRYTRDAIAARLIEAGHDPAAVETALERVLAVEVSGLLTEVTLLGYGGAVLLGLLGAVYGFQNADPRSGGHLNATIWLLLYSGAMLVGGGYSIRRMARAPSAPDAGRAIFIALVIAVAIFAGLSGVCRVGYNITF